MTDDQLIIWAAGFFDGEGCIAIGKQTKNRSRSDYRWTSYSLIVSASQKDPAPLKHFHEMFGGHFYSYQLKNGQTYWRWSTWSHGALHVLKTLQPFMVLKPGRAAVGIEFQESLYAWNRDYGRKGYPDWVREKLEGFFLQMKEFNRRGVSVLNPNPKKTGPGKGSADTFGAYAERKPRVDYALRKAEKLAQKGDLSVIQ